VPLAQVGPGGLATNAPLAQQDVELLRDRYNATVQPLQDRDRPHNAHMFFNIYYMMTGLHGIHVVIGMIVITWLLIKTFRGHFSSEYFTPIDLGGLYWHVVDLIWIFLFPLFYLI
jgi:heme/copper-type cytochrome/quinol oxidase subunit 3